MMLHDRLEGTPGYLPPEVLEDKKMKELTVLVDAWALGCLTYFCLNGRPPFFGDQEQVSLKLYYIFGSRHS